MSHTWNSAGAYYVKAKAIDEHSAQSEFSEELKVIICDESGNHEDPDPDDPDLDEDDEGGESNSESTTSILDLIYSLLNREISFIEFIQQLFTLIFAS